MRKKLPVPENIPLRWELFRGFGKPELLRTMLITGIVLAGCVVFCQFSDWKPRIMASVMAVLFTISFCCGFFEKMDNNQSIYDFLRQGRRYRKEQQTFWYQRKEVLNYYEQEERKD